MVWQGGESGKVAVVEQMNQQLPVSCWRNVGWLCRKVQAVDVVSIESSGAAGRGNKVGSVHTGPGRQRTSGTNRRSLPLFQHHFTLDCKQC